MLFLFYKIYKKIKKKLNESKRKLDSINNKQNLDQHIKKKEIKDNYIKNNFVCSDNEIEYDTDYSKYSDVYTSVWLGNDKFENNSYEKERRRFRYQRPNNVIENYYVYSNNYEPKNNLYEERRRLQHQRTYNFMKNFNKKRNSRNKRKKKINNYHKHKKCNIDETEYDSHKKDFSNVNLKNKSVDKKINFIHIMIILFFSIIMFCLFR